jgi:hypothetical protein
MPDETDNLVLHHLKALRHDINTRLDKLARSHDNLTAEVRISNTHVAALVQNEVHTTARLAEIEVRLPPRTCRAGARGALTLLRHPGAQ